MINDDVSKKYTRKKTLFACTEKKVGNFLKTLGLIYQREKKIYKQVGGYEEMMMSSLRWV